MFGPIQLHRLMRRYGRYVAAAVAVLAALALAATVHALGSNSGSEHHVGHTEGQTTDAVVLCVATGACVLAVVGTAVDARRLLERPLWLLGAPLLLAMPFVPAPARVCSRAGPPPPLLQVFRF